VALHLGQAHLVARSSWASRWLEGVPVVLVDHGRIDHRTRVAHMISRNDLAGALREKEWTVMRRWRM
jgi:uncharacterized membrane protein YcaP (DUF421 family)